MMKRILAFLLLAAVSVSAAPVKIRALALGSGEFPECFVKEGSKFVPIRFSKTQPSPMVKATLVSPLPIFIPTPDGEGDAEYSVAAKATLPAGAESVLLLGTMSGKEVKLVALKDDILSAGSKDWMLVNATTKPIAFQAGDDESPVLIKPGSSESHRITAEDGKGTAVSAQAKFGEKVKTIYSTYWPVFPDKRSLVLFVEIDGKIKVKRISDKLGG